MCMSRFKTALMASILTLAFALPMAAVPTTATAGDWFRVNNPGSHVDMHSNPNLQGRLKARISHGQYLEVAPCCQTYTQDRAFVKVRWMKKLGTMEWHWKSAFGRYIPHWNRTGWVDVNLVTQVDKPGGHWIN